MASAFGVIRRGRYAIGGALTAAGLARCKSVKGKVLLVTDAPGRHQLSAPLGIASALPHPAAAEFDAAMAEIERLPNSSSGQL